MNGLVNIHRSELGIVVCEVYIYELYDCVRNPSERDSTVKIWNWSIFEFKLMCDRLNFNRIKST